MVATSRLNVNTRQPRAKAKWKVLTIAIEYRSRSRTHSCKQTENVIRGYDARKMALERVKSNHRIGYLLVEHFLENEPESIFVDESKHPAVSYASLWNASKKGKASERAIQHLGSDIEETHCSLTLCLNLR